MQCHDIESLVADYVLGQLSEEQTRKVQRHLADCGACRQLATETREAAACLAWAPPAAAPPEELEQQLLEQISAPATVRIDRSTGDVAEAISVFAGRRGWIAAASLLAVAAGVGMWLGATTAAWRPGVVASDARRAAQEALSRRIDAIQRKNERAAGGALQYAALEGDANIEGYVAADLLARQWHLLVRGLAAPPAGRKYHVWLDVDNAKGADRWQKGGWLPLDAHGSASLVIEMPDDLRPVQRLIITAELPGVEEPTGKPQLVAPL